MTVEKVESFEADLTWLLHRSAQRMRAAMEEQSAKDGLDLRAYLVLTALRRRAGQTQLALGQAIGLDKTTLTVLLDRLEKDGHLVRKADPNDRRARLPEATKAGLALQARIARAVTREEKRLLSAFSEQQQSELRAMLRYLIGQGDLAGSCV